MKDVGDGGRPRECHHEDVPLQLITGGWGGGGGESSVSREGTQTAGQGGTSC